jgi:hypothetical protein
MTTSNAARAAERWLGAGLCCGSPWSGWSDRSAPLSRGSAKAGRQVLDIGVEGDPIPCRVSVRSSLHSSSPNSAYQRGHGGTGASRPVASFAVLQPVVTPASPVGSLFGSSGEQPSGSVRAEPAGRGSSKIETSKRCNVIRFREQPFRGMRQMRGLDTAVSFSRLVLRCIRTIVG